MQALTIGHMTPNHLVNSRSSNTKFNCNHITYFKIIPAIDDVVYCMKCKTYQTVIASGTDKWVALCVTGEDNTNDPKHDCYMTHIFTSETKARGWAKHHKHHAIVDYRSVN